MFFFSWWFELRKQLLMLLKTLQNLTRFRFFWFTLKDFQRVNRFSLFKALLSNELQQKQMSLPKTISSVLTQRCFDLLMSLLSMVCLGETKSMSSRKNLSTILVSLHVCCLTCFSKKLLFCFSVVLHHSDQKSCAKIVCLKKVEMRSTSLLPQSALQFLNFFF